MKVSFNGNVALSDLEPPHAYRITGEGSGGVAGFAKGSAGVRLEPENGATSGRANPRTSTIAPSTTPGRRLLSPTKSATNADAGRKIAQLGARLIDGTAKKLSAEFFEKLGAVIAPPAPPPPVTEEPAASLDKPSWFSKTFGSSPGA